MACLYLTYVISCIFAALVIPRCHKLGELIVKPGLAPFELRIVIGHFISFPLAGDAAVIDPGRASRNGLLNANNAIIMGKTRLLCGIQ